MALAEINIPSLPTLVARLPRTAFKPASPSTIIHPAAQETL
jgi:hypothetical protein